MVLESLVERDSRGRFIPHLAKSWRSSQGYKVWTFKLRTGIKFSNGEAFNAEVAKLNIDIGSGAAILLNQKYAPYRGTGIGVNANIQSVEAVSADTLRITLVKPSNEFIGLMYRAGRYVMRAPAMIEDVANCPFTAIGTGPFMLESWQPDKSVLVRNPNYWRKDSKGQRLPYLDKINVTTIKEGSQRAAALRKGTVDAAFFNINDATFIKDMQKRKSLLTEYQGVAGQWGQWMPNQLKTGSPFIHKNCRVAVAYALDWNAYNKVRLRGLATVNGSIVGNSHVMYTTKGAYKHDLTKAKEFVEKCNTDLGSAAPFTVTLYADTTNQSLNNTKFVETQLKKAGIAVNNTFQAESNVLISQIYNLKGNQMDFAQGTPAEGAGSGYVAPFFLSNGFPADSTSPVANSSFKIYGKIIALGNHTDTTYDNLVYAAMAETNKSKQSAAWKKSTEYLQREAIAIPTLHVGTWTFVNRKSNLKGIGLLKNPDGKTFAPTKDIKGQEWTGVWKG
jgi:ABC-type transport system substrate-binding protein